MLTLSGFYPTYPGFVYAFNYAICVTRPSGKRLGEITFRSAVPFWPRFPATSGLGLQEVSKSGFCQILLWFEADR